MNIPTPAHVALVAAHFSAVFNYANDYDEDHAHYHVEAAQALYDALAQPEPSTPTNNQFLELLGEYWDLAFAEGKEGRLHDNEAGDANRVHARLREMFAAPRVQPVQPTPLTKDQLSAALRSVDPLMARLPAGLEEFARAIEVAHGIGAKDEK